MTKVLVCGGRNYPHADRIFAVLDDLQPRLVIAGCSGSQTVSPSGRVVRVGADLIALRWAYARGVPSMRFRAAWGCYGRKSGPLRNGWMLEYGNPDLVIAFPGGRGTANMVDQAKKAGVPVELEN